MNVEHRAATEALCLACGLCCNGVLFVDVRLQPEDDAARLAALGFPIKPGAASCAGRAGANGPRFAQPCTAHDGCRCRAYEARPAYCRQFECLLLSDLTAGRIKKEAALRIVQRARKRVATVLRLMRDLGDCHDERPLSTRFKQITRRVEKEGLDEAASETYGKLTLAVHDLNLILAGAFYPG
jgi:uncharacterized protein